MPGNPVRFAFAESGAKGVSSQIDQIKDKFGKLQSVGAKGFAFGVGAQLAISAVHAVGAAVEDVVGGSIDAYRNEEVAQTRLNQSLAANVDGWNGNTDAIRAATNASEQLGFTNTETTDSLATLVGATHDVSKALQILSVAQDLARYKNISLGDAVDALTKIEGGSFRILKSLGIDLPKGTTQVAALAAVMKVAGGQAQQFATTDLGQVDVASAKVEASQEKLGKSMSNIAAAVLPALADGLDNVTNAFLNLGNAEDQLGTIGSGVANAITSGTEADLANAKQALLTGLADLQKQKFAPIGPLHVFADPQIDADIAALQHQLDLVNAALVGGHERERGYASGLDAMGAASIVAAGGAGRTANSIEFLSTEALLATGSVDTLAASLEDHLFGAASRKGQEANLAKTIGDLKKQLSDTTNKRDAEILAGQIADARKQLFDLQLQEAEAAGPAALQAFLKKEEAAFRNTDKQAYELTLQIEAMARAAGKLPTGEIGFTFSKGGFTGSGHAARGAHARKGQPFTVGEEGEELFVPDEAGTIVPHDQTKAMMAGGTGLGVGGASVTVNVVLPNAYGMTPGQGEALGRVIAPHVIRALQKSRLLPAGVR